MIFSGENIMKYRVDSGFPEVLKTKIKKTREGRNGGGIYKRRNRRDYRVVMKLDTYKKICDQDKSILDKYKEGFAVRVKPEEYFKDNGEIQENFPEDLELGLNAFIFFKTIDQYNNFFKYCKDFDEVIELKTEPDQSKVFESWIGKQCCYVLNTEDPIVSLICTTKYENKKKDTEEMFRKLQEKDPNLLEKMSSFKNGKPNKPKQAGLGNIDMDYTSPEEQLNVQYQMAFLIYKVKGMKAELQRLLNLSSEEIDRCENHVKDFCIQNDLINFEKLAEFNIWDKSLSSPICPLCKKELTWQEFFETVEQDEGREEEDNTQTAIELMHIKPLYPGEFNHCTYNLAWGHKHCNIIQGNSSISETLEKLKAILQSNRII
jgi:hypothetical protein